MTNAQIANLWVAAGICTVLLIIIGVIASSIRNARRAMREEERDLDAADLREERKLSQADAKLQLDRERLELEKMKFAYGVFKDGKWQRGENPSSHSSDEGHPQLPSPRAKRTHRSRKGRRP